MSDGHIVAAAQRIGFKIRPEHYEEYMAVVAKFELHCQKVLSQPDYVPKPELQRFPRSDIHLPNDEDNDLGAWSWKAKAGSTTPNTLLDCASIVLKDTICLAEVPLRLGTDAFAAYTPEVDATVVSRVMERGGRILGKAACESFSHGTCSSTSPFGPVRNPHARDFSAGGSSSGCGALLGAGQVDMALASDQGGSIRIPAAMCGCVGLKPTFGLVPYTGIVSAQASMDHAGPMARTVRDTARLLQAIAGYDGIDDRQLGAPAYDSAPRYLDILERDRQRDLGGLRIGVLKESFELPMLDASVAAVVKEAIEVFPQLGAEIQDVSVPIHSLAPSITPVLNRMGSGSVTQGRQTGRRGLALNSFWGNLLPWDQDKYDKAKYLVTGVALCSEYAWQRHPTVYGRATNLARKLKDDFDAALRDFDVLVMPTCPQPARRHLPPNSGPSIWESHNPGTTVIAAAFNATGHPAMSIPVGTVPPMAEDVHCEADKAIRLPVGMMIVGNWWDESTVLRVGDAWEKARDWRK